ncbi:14916_t:CDS:2, partial [Dentiscutata heterogama]
YLQPCDAGIIWSFKAYYRKLFCENRIAAYEEATETELMEDFELVDLTSQSSQTLSIADPTNLVTEIQSLINRLPITNPILANDYIEADHSVETNVMPSDAEIINAVLDRDCNEDDEVEPEVRVSHKEVITNINKILRFIDQEDGFKVDESFIKKLCSFKKDVVRDSIALQRQTTLDLYLQV